MFSGKQSGIIRRAFPTGRLTFAAPLFADRKVGAIVVYGHNVSGLDLDPEERRDPLARGGTRLDCVARDRIGTLPERGRGSRQSLDATRRSRRSRGIRCPANRRVLLGARHTDIKFRPRTPESISDRDKREPDERGQEIFEAKAAAPRSPACSEKTSPGNSS